MSLQPLTTSGRDSSDPPQWKSMAVLPYVRRVSEAIRRVLTRLQIRVCYKSQANPRSLFPSPKDHPTTTQMSSVVYKVPCSKCQASYIGQTGRILSK